MSEWQPIESYTALHVTKRPRFAVFYVKEQNQNGKYHLRDMVITERYFGNRIITHWMPLPEPPK